jgi:hypothetical protein
MYDVITGGFASIILFPSRQNCKAHFALRRDPSKKHLFMAKYIAIHLEIDKVARVCVGLEFHDGCWHLNTVLAKRSEIMDERDWTVCLPQLVADNQRVEVKRSKGGSSSYIKDFNSWTVCLPQLVADNQRVEVKRSKGGSSSYIKDFNS